MNNKIYELCHTLGVDQKPTNEQLSIIDSIDNGTLEALKNPDYEYIEISEGCANTAAEYMIENSHMLFGLFVCICSNITIYSLSTYLVTAGVASFNVIASLGIITAGVNIIFLIFILQSIRSIIGSYFLAKVASTNRIMIERMVDELGQEVADVIMDGVVEWED